MNPRRPVILEKIVQFQNQKSWKMNLLGLQMKHVFFFFENMQYFNIRYKILLTPFQYYLSYRLLNVVRYGGEIQCLNYLLCEYLNTHCIYDLQVIVIANKY